MRSRQRDTNPAITFSLSITDAANGGGVAQPGAIPYTFTRTGTGVYGINIDARLRPIAAVVTSIVASRQADAAVDFGFVQVTHRDAAGTLVNGSFQATVTAM